MNLDERWVRERLAERADEPTRVVLESLVRDRFPLFNAESVDQEVSRVSATLDGLGPLQQLLEDPLVTDVLINGPGPVWVERVGALQRSPVEVTDYDIAVLVERTFHRAGRSVDRAHPIGDTHLHDGTRLSVVLAPLALNGPVIALRRPARNSIALERFANTEVVGLLRDAVRERANLLVYGATGSGKTTLVSALTASVDHGERIVTIEDAAELRIDHPHVVSLECRPENSEGKGSVSLRDLVAASLRLRPDRIVLGEARGPEALDVVWALASGHRGSFATCHAASAQGALERLETFVAMGDAALPHRVIRAQVRGAFDVAVGVQRAGSRRCVTAIHRIGDGPSGASGVDPLWELAR